MMFRGKKVNLFSVDMLAYALVVVFVVIFIFLSIGRHEALKSFQNDLGVYMQILWNTMHGHWFEASGALLPITLQPDGTTLEHFNYLSAHFSPILILLIPFYALWPDGKMLLILQALAVGLGALPIYWLAKGRINSSWAGLVFLLSYLFYPILHNALLYDFHEVTLAVPLVTFALWFWYKNKIGWMIGLLALLMLVQEHASLIVFMFGLYIAFFQKRWKFGFGVAAVALAYFVVVMAFVIPAFSTTGQSTLIQTSNFPTRYQWLGSSLGDIVNTFIHKPGWVLQNMLGARRLDFLITLLLPLCGFPIFSALFLLSLPVLVIYFLSQFYLTYSIYYYHSAILVGIIYFAGIFGFSRLIKEKSRQVFFLILILTASLISGYLYSVTPWSGNYSWRDYRPSANARLLPEVQKLIPEAAAISVQHNLGPHFANRRALFHFPFMIDRSDYVIVDVYNPYAGNPQSVFGLGDAIEIEDSLWLGSIEDMLHQEQFGVIYFQDGWFVFQRGASRYLNAAASDDFSGRLNNFSK